MRLYLTIVLASLAVVQIQSKSLPEDKKENKDLWQPPNGKTREEWLRCHGFDCEEWGRTKQKLKELKMITAGTRFDYRTLMNDTDDSLDNCIWLTEDQIDSIFYDMEEDLEQEGSGKGKSKGKGKDKVLSRKKRQYTDLKTYPFSMWPNKHVPWKFDGEHTAQERAVVRGAFSHWQEQTCISFPELQTLENYIDHHILVTRKSTGCHSFIGRINSIPQQLNVQTECLYNLGTPVHEVGHALGMWHEQQRSDRDDTIRVLWENLGYYVGQFHKQRTLNVVEYNLASVMHYGPKDGSNNSKNTMESVDPLYQNTMGQRVGLSFLDVKATNLIYCSDVCASKLSGCLNGGYQDPKDCSRCRCPDGLAGTYCDQVAPPVNAQCGGEVNLNSQYYIQSPNYNTNQPYNNQVTCSWLIKVPQGEKVSLSFEGDFSLYAYYQQQCHHWVEVRYKQDLGTLGPRFCGYQKPNVTLVSDTNQMLVVFKSNWTTDSPNARLGFRAKLVPVKALLTTTTAATTTTPRSTTTTVATTTTTIITTTTTHLPTPTPTTAKVGENCDVMDMILVMDSSGGVMAENWVKVLQFAKNIVGRFNLSPRTVRIGAVTYSSYADIAIPLSDNGNDLISALQKIPFLGGSTNTHIGLVVMRADFSTYARANVRRVGVLITDGQTALPAMAIEQAKMARQEGIELYVAGISHNFDYKEALAMVEDPQHILQIETFDDLVSPLYNYGLSTEELVCNKRNTGETSDLNWSCDFESGNFCDMIQDQETDQFDWTVYSGRTPSGATGPMSAYRGLYYAYIEASSPRKPGDGAILYLPTFNAEGSHCVRFAYNMYGFHIRTLQLMKVTPSRAMAPLWLKTGEQGTDWFVENVLVELNLGDQLLFLAKRGDEYSGDIAIDDISITGGFCQ